jgi:CubicO group peptidase (beta-lactamase class C family)
VIRRRSVRLLLMVLVVLLLVPATWFASAAVIYGPTYVRRVLAWRDSDVWDYLDNFPHRRLIAAADPVRFPSAPDDARVEAAFAEALGVEDFPTLLEETDTQAFIVIQHEQVIYERYANGWQRDSLVTSFSVAKSFVSTLVGMAIEEGYIGSLDDPITRYLPELAERDARFEQVTIRHLLTMSSGFAYQEMRWFLFNGDDPLTTYYPDQRELALEHTRIERSPGEVFHYNKYHPQLLGMILERTTGMSVTAWTQTRLWEPLGMEFDGSWSLDSEESGFEKMEAGLNARAIDFAKLGQLFLAGGAWRGEQLISTEWVALASGVDPAGRAPEWDATRYYALMWWGLRQPDGTVDFYAAGDHGQYIYVSPANHIVIVRTGVEYGISSHRWTDAFASAAAALGR